MENLNISDRDLLDMFGHANEPEHLCRTLRIYDLESGFLKPGEYDLEIFQGVIGMSIFRVKFGERLVLHVCTSDDFRVFWLQIDCEDTEFGPPSTLDSCVLCLDYPSVMDLLGKWVPTSAALNPVCAARDPGIPVRNCLPTFSLLKQLEGSADD